MWLRGLLGLALLCAALNDAGAEPRDSPRSLKGDGAELVYLVRCLKRLGEGKFVRVDIDRVRNPGVEGLAFQVHFQDKDDTRKYLGSFALFPADNPGRFIVPARGLIGSEGEIVLTIDPVPDADAKNVEVWVRSVDLVDEVDP